MDRDYGLFVPSWPATLGGDGAGVVEAVGDDVKSFKQGDEVFARFTPGNDRSAAFQVRMATQSFWNFVDISSDFCCCGRE